MKYTSDGRMIVTTASETQYGKYTNLPSLQLKVNLVGRHTFDAPNLHGNRSRLCNLSRLEDEGKVFPSYCCVNAGVFLFWR
jgi:hypothetical protein